MAALDPAWAVVPTALLVAALAARVMVGIDLFTQDYREYAERCALGVALCVASGWLMGGTFG